MNLLSLDAPVVALTWQDFLSRCYPSPLPPQARFVLGLTVWAIYIGDRLLDTRNPAGHETSRHLFYRGNRRLAGFALGAIVVLDLWIALFWRQQAIIRNGAILALSAAAYLWIFVAHGIGSVILKKAAAGVLFSGGVFLVARTLGGYSPDAWLLPALSFALLCIGNLVLVEQGERHRETGRICLGLLLLATLCASTGSRWYLAIALSATGLAILAVAAGKLSDDARHAIADAMLLTPLFLR